MGHDETYLNEREELWWSKGGEIDAGALQPVAELANQAVIQADQYSHRFDWQARKQTTDMVLLTPENSCQDTAFTPNGKTSCP